MNCEPGDLAIRIKAPVGCVYIPVGTIVKVLGNCSPGDLGRGCITPDVWDVEVRGDQIGPSGYPYGIPDNELRPIRDKHGEDETLAWAVVPSILLWEKA